MAVSEHEEARRWALQRLRGVVLNHLKLGSNKQVGSFAVRCVADLARQWGASPDAIRRTISAAVESSADRNSPKSRILKEAFLLI